MQERIDNANIPEPLKNALDELSGKVEALSPDLPGRQRFVGLLGRIVEEATDSDKGTHWWETAFDLIAKGTGGQNEIDQTIQRLAPLMQQHLGPYEDVSLQEITAQTVDGICFLSDTLTAPKKNYVAPNAMSLAEAHFSKHAWFRAVYAGKAPVGFLMIVDNDEDAEYFLWRFMIAEPFHGRGYARQAIARLVEYVKIRPGAKELLVSCVQGEGSPEGFYVKLGFEHTGDMMGNEAVLRLVL